MDDIGMVEDNIGYEAWCERQALLKVVRVAEEFVNNDDKWIDGINTGYQELREALEALPPHLRGE